MAPETLKTGTLTASLALVLAAEGAAWWGIRATPLPPMLLLGLVRLIQIIGLAWLAVLWEGGLGAIGLSPRLWLSGFKKGVLWSAVFALIAVLGMTALWLWGLHPLSMLRAPLPRGDCRLVLFFLVGGLIAPVAEEIFFRGFLYTYFRSRGISLARRLGLNGSRPFGIGLAILGSTLIFVVLHSIHGLPLTQIIGGLVFALAYETTRNLVVPISIHVAGNLAIFSISLLPRHFIG